MCIGLNTKQSPFSTRLLSVRSPSFWRLFFWNAQVSCGEATLTVKIPPFKVCVCVCALTLTQSNLLFPQGSCRYAAPPFEDYSFEMRKFPVGKQPSLWRFLHLKCVCVCIDINTKQSPFAKKTPVGQQPLPIKIPPFKMHKFPVGKQPSL